MGIVSWIVGSVEGYLATAGETAFGALLGSVGTIGMAMATLAVVFVALNAMLQVKSIDLRTAVMLGVKLALVGIFARNWAEFKESYAGMGRQEMFDAQMSYRAMHHQHVARARAICREHNR